MCENVEFAYYCTAIHPGKSEFDLGTVGAKDEVEARERLIELYRSLWNGPDPRIMSIRFGHVSAVNVKRRYVKES